MMRADTVPMKPGTNFSKVSLLLNSLYEMTVELTFENLYCRAHQDKRAHFARRHGADLQRLVAAI